MSDGNMTYEDWLRGCVHHDGRHGEVTLSTDKVLEIANYIQLTRTSLTDGMIELPPYDRKTELNCSEKPNNCEWSVEYAKEMLNTMSCEECGHWEHGAHNHYYCALLEMRQECCFESKDESTLMFANKPKDEPQTMLNDGTLVINVEDATKVGRVLVGDDKNRGDLYYPDDEDEPQTDCAWK